MGKIFRWTLLFVVLVIFASGAVAVYTVFFSTSGDVTMPPLREMSVIDAVAEAERLGFSVKIEQTPSSLPPGRVLAQSPEPGARVRKDKVVILQVSKGGSRRPVPDVRGLDLVRAQSVVREQGFEVGDVVQIKDDSRPGGSVIAQSPAAPANVPVDKKIDLLISQGGPGKDGKIQVPDVAQMSEQQARDLLTTNGLKIAAVDYVYSPNASEGYVIGTRPIAGTTARSGEGVRLKVATTKRPEGVPETQTVPRVTEPSGEGASSQVVVSVPGHGNVFVGDGTTAEVNIAAAPDRESDPNVSVFDQQRTPRVIPNPSLPAGTANTGGAPSASAPGTSSTTTQPPTPSPASLQPSGGKVAKVRYQVPPLARPLALKIEMVDPSGTKVLLSRDAKSGEYVSLDAPYSKECAVTIYLGGEFVWQDKYM